jgi:hypothetical protein
MATQAENPNSQWKIWRQEVWIWAKLALQFWKSGTRIWSLDWRIMTHNPPIVTTGEVNGQNKKLI